MRCVVSGVVFAVVAAVSANAQGYVGASVGGFTGNDREGLGCFIGLGNSTVSCREPSHWVGGVGIFGGYDFTQGPLVFGFEARGSGEFSPRRFGTTFRSDPSPFATQAVVSYTYHRLFGATIGPRIGFRAEDWLFYTHAGAGADRYRQSWNEIRSGFFPSQNFSVSASRDEWVPTILGAMGIERSFGNIFVRTEVSMSHSLWPTTIVTVPLAPPNTLWSFGSQGDRTTYGVSVGAGMRF